MRCEVVQWMIVLVLFTGGGGELIAIEPGNVAAVYPAHQEAGASPNAKSAIATVNGTFYVRESPEEVIDKLSKTTTERKSQ